MTSQAVDTSLNTGSKRYIIKQKPKKGYWLILEDTVRKGLWCKNIRLYLRRDVT